MNLDRSVIVKWAATAVVAGSSLLAAASANAEVNWSVGVSVPGVVVTEPAPVYYEPAPAYAPPPPVYYQAAPPVYYRPAPPTYYRPPPVYYGPPAPVYYEGERWRHRRHERRDWDDRD